MRDVFWIQWKFPERHARLYDDYRAEPPWNKPASRETVLMDCMRYAKRMRPKIEEAERRIKTITRAEIEEFFGLNKWVAIYADANIKSKKMKEALGRP